MSIATVNMGLAGILAGCSGKLPEKGKATIKLVKEERTKDLNVAFLTYIDRTYLVRTREPCTLSELAGMLNSRYDARTSAEGLARQNPDFEAVVVPAGKNVYYTGLWVERMGPNIITL
ncbi:MAG: hypothetical protein V1743_05285 [Nanoarchaeota archaeon]